MEQTTGSRFRILTREINPRTGEWADQPSTTEGGCLAVGEYLAHRMTRRLGRLYHRITLQVDRGVGWETLEQYFFRNGVPLVRIHRGELFRPPVRLLGPESDRQIRRKSR